MQRRKELSQKLGTVSVISRNGKKTSDFPMFYPVCLIGSGRNCDIIVSLPNIPEELCRVEINKYKEAFLVKLKGDYEVTLNGRSVSTPCQLKTGDIIGIGDRKMKFITADQTSSDHLLNSESIHATVGLGTRVNPFDVAYAYIEKREDQPGLEARWINPMIGRGVFATKEFLQGHFLLEYPGVLLSGEKAKMRTNTNYNFHFEFERKNYCIDATKELPTGPKLGRLVNHGDKPCQRNAVMKRVIYNNTPYLCLFSTRTIAPDDQILYNYGVKNLPWQKLGRGKETVGKRKEDGQIRYTENGDNDIKSGEVAGLKRTSNAETFEKAQSDPGTKVKEKLSAQVKCKRKGGAEAGKKRKAVAERKGRAENVTCKKVETKTGINRKRNAETEEDINALTSQDVEMKGRAEEVVKRKCVACIETKHNGHSKGEKRTGVIKAEKGDNYDAGTNVNRSVVFATLRKRKGVKRKCSLVSSVKSKEGYDKEVKRKFSIDKAVRKNGGIKTGLKRYVSSETEIKRKNDGETGVKIRIRAQSGLQYDADSEVIDNNGAGQVKKQNHGPEILEKRKRATERGRRRKDVSIIGVKLGGYVEREEKSKIASETKGSRKNEAKLEKKSKNADETKYKKAQLAKKKLNRKVGTETNEKRRSTTKTDNKNNRGEAIQEKEAKTRDKGWGCSGKEVKGQNTTGSGVKLKGGTETNEKSDSSVIETRKNKGAEKRVKTKSGTEKEQKAKEDTEMNITNNWGTELNVKGQVCPKTTVKKRKVGAEATEERNDSADSVGIKTTGPEIEKNGTIANKYWCNGTKVSSIRGKQSAVRKQFSPEIGVKSKFGSRTVEESKGIAKSDENNTGVAVKVKTKGDVEKILSRKDGAETVMIGKCNSEILLESKCGVELEVKPKIHTETEVKLECVSETKGKENGVAETGEKENAVAAKQDVEISDANRNITQSGTGGMDEIKTEMRTKTVFETGRKKENGSETTVERKLDAATELEWNEGDKKKEKNGKGGVELILERKFSVKTEVKRNDSEVTSIGKVDAEKEFKRKVAVEVGVKRKGVTETKWSENYVSGKAAVVTDNDRTQIRKPETRSMVIGEEEVNKRLGTETTVKRNVGSGTRLKRTIGSETSIQRKLSAKTNLERNGANEIGVNTKQGTTTLVKRNGRNETSVKSKCNSKTEDTTSDGGRTERIEMDVKRKHRTSSKKQNEQVEGAVIQGVDIGTKEGNLAEKISDACSIRNVPGYMGSAFVLIERCDDFKGASNSSTDHTVHRIYQTIKRKSCEVDKTGSLPILPKKHIPASDGDCLTEKDSVIFCMGKHNENETLRALQTEHMHAVHKDTHRTHETSEVNDGNSMEYCNETNREKNNTTCKKKSEEVLASLRGKRDDVFSFEDSTVSMYRRDKTPIVNKYKSKKTAVCRLDVTGFAPTMHKIGDNQMVAQSNTLSDTRIIPQISPQIITEQKGTTQIVVEESTSQIIDSSQQSALQIAGTSQNNPEIMFTGGKKLEQKQQQLKQQKQLLLQQQATLQQIQTQVQLHKQLKINGPTSTGAASSSAYSTGQAGSERDTTDVVTLKSIPAPGGASPCNTDTVNVPVGRQIIHEKRASLNKLQRKDSPSEQIDTREINVDIVMYDRKFMESGIENFIEPYINESLSASNNERGYINDTYNTALPENSEEFAAGSSGCGKHNTAFSFKGITGKKKRHIQLKQKTRVGDTCFSTAEREFIDDDSEECQLADYDDSDKDPTYEESDDGSDESEESTSDNEPLNVEVIEAAANHDALDETTNIADLEADVQSNNITIPKTTAYIDGKRVIDKKHCCMFCNKFYMRIARHLKTHKKEDEIQKLKDLSSQERRKELDRLRLHGDHIHNTTVIATNKGHLIVARRPSKTFKDYNYNDFAPCEFCKGYFLRWELWRHQKTCQFKHNIKDNARRNQAQRNSVILMESSKPVRAIDETFLEDVVSRMIIDDVSITIRNDCIAMKYGELMYTNLSKDKRKASSVSSDLRLLGRLVLKMRTNTEEKNGYLKDFLKVKYFDDIIKVAHELSMIDQTNDRAHFIKPSVGQKVGRLLNKCCIILDGEAIRRNDEEDEKNATRFRKLIKNEWSLKVNAISHQTAKERRRNNPVVLPTTDDLLKLKQFLDDEIAGAKEALLSAKTMPNFQYLSELVLCRLIMFNRRRSGEVSQIRMADYLDRPEWQNMVNHEIFQSLCPVEQQLVQRLDMIQIPDKTSRPVGLIITPEIAEVLELLLQYRGTVGVDPDNTYLFPRATGDGYIEGHECLRELADSAGLEFPKRVCATTMRKYIATVVQVLNLNKIEVEWLANHLGHSVDIHKDFYRCQNSAIELGRVAKILMAVDKGKTVDWNQIEGEDQDTFVNSDDGESDDKSASDEIYSDNEIVYTAEEGDIHSNSLENGSEYDSDYSEVEMNNTFKGKMRRKGQPRKYWTSEENSAIKRQFGKMIRTMTVPGKEACERAKEMEPMLHDRSWSAIKYKVHNTIQAVKRTTRLGNI